MIGHTALEIKTKGVANERSLCSGNRQIMVSHLQGSPRTDELVILKFTAQVNQVESALS